MLRPGCFSKAALPDASLHLVENGYGDGERGAGIGHIHDARDAAFTGAARQQEIDLRHWQVARQSGTPHTRTGFNMKEDANLR